MHCFGSDTAHFQKQVIQQQEFIQCHWGMNKHVQKDQIWNQPLLHFWSAFPQKYY